MHCAVELPRREGAVAVGVRGHETREYHVVIDRHVAPVAGGIRTPSLLRFYRSDAAVGALRDGGRLGARISLRSPIEQEAEVAVWQAVPLTIVLEQYPQCHCGAGFE